MKRIIRAVSLAILPAALALGACDYEGHAEDDQVAQAIELGVIGRVRELAGDHHAARGIGAERGGL